MSNVKSTANIQPKRADLKQVNIFFLVNKQSLIKTTYSIKDYTINF